MKSCLTCGQSFEPNSNRQKYCADCGRRGIGVCEECDVTFKRTRGSGRYCSKSCAYFGIRRRNGTLPRPCEKCGTEFLPQSRGRRFCSRKCSGKVRIHPVGTRKVTTKGYVRLKTHTGWRPEHHIVMEESLGRRLIEGETVHHKNGRRDDNRLENLELWFSPQPYGQRVEDLIRYVVEFHADRVRVRL